MDDLKWCGAYVLFVCGKDEKGNAATAKEVKRDDIYAEILSATQNEDCASLADEWAGACFECGHDDHYDSKSFDVDISFFSEDEVNTELKNDFCVRYITGFAR